MDSVLSKEHDHLSQNGLVMREVPIWSLASSDWMRGSNFRAGKLSTSRSTGAKRSPTIQHESETL